MKIMMIPTHHQTYNINTHQPPQQHQYLPPPGTLYTSPRAPQSIQLTPIQSFTKSQAVFPQSVRDSAPAANFNRYGSDSAGYIQYTPQFHQKTCPKIQDNFN